MQRVYLLVTACLRGSKEHDDREFYSLVTKAYSARNPLGSTLDDREGAELEKMTSISCPLLIRSGGLIRPQNIPISRRLSPTNTTATRRSNPSHLRPKDKGGDKTNDGQLTHMQKRSIFFFFFKKNELFLLRRARITVDNAREFPNDAFPFFNGCEWTYESSRVLLASE